MNLSQNQSLRSFNTFGLDQQAKLFGRFEDVESLIGFIETDFLKDRQLLLLGGGSNILLTCDFEGVVLKNEITGISVIKENDDHIWVSVGAGQNWHSFVLHAIANGWAGIENLSLIPGTVGAAPMQNIGAYGVEIKQVFNSLEAVALKDGCRYMFTATDCEFGYRESIFKTSAKGEYVITAVNFRLNKVPTFNTSYGAITATLSEMGVEELSIKAVSDAVIKIRQSKLPDPTEIGNAGSFFKNPTISKDQFDRVKGEYPDMPGYEVDAEHTKVPAGWLIEQCGWKGFREGDIGVHKNQALVLVNYGQGKGRDIFKLALAIQASVMMKFGISITPEVNVI
ncbi:MAG: UDP-N-acetylmuramate dehydrogenase [Cyclobacteriaceae bacterium]